MSRNLTARYAAITSTAALVVALGGAGYATGLIGTNQIQNNAITSPKIKDNTVSGKDVQEGSLGQVPKADKANAANTVNGVKAFTIDYRAASPTGNVVILHAGSLTLTASCAGGNNVAVTAMTSAANASVYTFVGSDATAADPLEADTEGGGLTPGVPFNMLATGDGNVDLVQFYYDTTTGTTITGSFSVNENPGCAAEGHALMS